jgi:hypothetical protein
VHDVAGGVPGEPPRRRQPLEGGPEHLPVELGDHEPPRPGAVAVVAESEPGLGLGPALLGLQLRRLVPVGQLGGHHLEHPPARLAQSPGVHAVDRLDDQPGLRRGALLGRHVVRQPLGGPDDHARLVHADASVGQRFPGRVVGLLQPPR